MKETYYSVFTWTDIGGIVVHRCILPPPGVLHEAITCNICKREFSTMKKRDPFQLVWYILVKPGIPRYADRTTTIAMETPPTIFDEIGNFNDITS